VVVLTLDKVPLLIISMEETQIAKSEAKEVVSYLRDQLGLRVAMITGDNQHAALKVAKHLGIKP
jgi:P-type E1-E2 ATPase